MIEVKAYVLKDDHTKMSVPENSEFCIEESKYRSRQLLRDHLQLVESLAERGQTMVPADRSLLMKSEREKRDKQALTGLMQ